jgi:hypothetical protein
VADALSRVVPVGCGEGEGEGAPSRRDARDRLLRRRRRQDPTDCLLAAHATLKTCLTTWTPDRYALNDQLAALAKTHGFGFLKSRGWFCSGYSCPMVVGNTVMYRDTGHITQVYALKLVLPFRAAFRRCIFDSCQTSSSPGPDRRR